MTNSANRIDLDQQLNDLFNKEQILAFFDFQLKWKGGEPVSGLCKISRPKVGESRSKYFSVFFIMDTPNERVRKHVRGFVNGINWNSFRRTSPGVKSVFPIPYRTISSEIFFAEADIYVSKSTEINKSYIITCLYPALRKIAGLKAGELIFWDDLLQEQRKPTPSFGHPSEGGDTEIRNDTMTKKEIVRSLIQKLKEMVR